MRGHFVALVAAVGVVACTPFTTDAGAHPSADGGDAGATAIPRDVHVLVDWPTAANLDPRADNRVREILVTVGASSVKTFAESQFGPYDFPAAPVVNGTIDVTIELRGDGSRVLGFGARKGFRLDADGNVTVSVRKRVVYFISADRNDGELRTLDGAPSMETEPSLKEIESPALTSLKEPTGLFVSTDGKLLVESGKDASGNGTIATFLTSSHQPNNVVSLPIVPAAIAPFGDGYEALAIGQGPGETDLRHVDLRNKVVAPLSLEIAGGRYEFPAAANSVVDGRVAFVTNHVSTVTKTPYLAVIEPGTRRVTVVKLSGFMEEVRAVRFTMDGGRIVVAGFKPSGTWSTGVVAVFDAATPTQPSKTFALAADKTKPTALVLFPDGKSAFIGNETNYESPSCCNEPRIINLESGVETWAGKMTSSGPEYEVLNALRFPYAPFRVLGGQSDSGNNSHGAVVEIQAPDRAPVDVFVDRGPDVGSVNGLASPFSTSL